MFAVLCTTWGMDIWLSFLLFARFMRHAACGAGMSLALPLTQQATFSWISRKDGVMERTLSGNINSGVLSTTPHDSAARDAFFQHTLQLFSQHQFLCGVS